MSINFNDVTNITLGSTPVEQIADSLGNVLWSAAPVVLPNYFYVEDVSGSNNTLSITKGDSSAPDVEVFYSTDKQNWFSMGTTSTTAITATIPANDKLYFKANTNSFYNNRITSQYDFNVGGNIMSLLYGDNFEDKTTFPSGTTKNFQQLFQTSNSHIINAENLILPATTLAEACYRDMFNGCSSLTTAPALPATTLATGCYRSMFNQCASLTTAPTILPATTLTKSCYNGMFENCTALTATPALPATTLADTCYAAMFRSCISLTTSPVLPAATLAQSCYNGMFENCTALTAAPTLPATTLAGYCYNSMFRACRSLATTPALPATTLAQRCYANMFEGCTALTTAPALPATTLTSYCYNSMFYGCTSLNEVTTYAQDISANSCLYRWLYNVAATGDFYNLGGATYTTDSPSGIPSGWTEHTSL